MKSTIMTRIFVAITCCVVAAASIPLAHAQATIDPVEKWAWGGNVGWLNFAPSHGQVTIFRTHLEGDLWGENIGWVSLGAPIPGLIDSYANTSADDYGVNHNGMGHLSGYAWGTNVGWINFAPTHGGVTIEGGSGAFTGWAWAENVGWIHFRDTGAVSYGVTAVGFPGVLGIPTVRPAGAVVLVLLLAAFGVIIVRRLREA